jgi:hypothetical protein
MTTITYEAGLGGAPDAAEPSHKSWLQRLVSALEESRLRRAEQELRQYRHALPQELEWSLCKLGPKSRNELPFLRQFE